MKRLLVYCTIAMAMAATPAAQGQDLAPLPKDATFGTLVTLGDGSQAVVLGGQEDPQNQGSSIDPVNVDAANNTYYANYYGAGSMGLVAPLPAPGTGTWEGPYEDTDGNDNWFYVSTDGNGCTSAAWYDANLNLLVSAAPFNANTSPVSYDQLSAAITADKGITVPLPPDPSDPDVQTLMQMWTAADGTEFVVVTYLIRGRERGQRVIWIIQYCFFQPPPIGGVPQPPVVIRRPTQTRQILITPPAF